MKKNLLCGILCGFLLPPTAVFADPVFDEQIIETQKENLWNQVESDYTNFTQDDDAAKQGQFTNILNSLSGSVLAEQWTYEGGGNWPVVDWNLVGDLESFFEDQDALLLYASGVPKIAQTNAEAAEVEWLIHLLTISASLGESWFGVWIQNLAKGADSNLKRIAYRSVDEFGEDFARAHPDEQAVTDWNAWKLAYDQSNKLGKAILLKCMTRLALITDDWDKLTQIHLSVFNGNDDDLKAIALVKGDNGLGDGVIDKWKDIAQNSTNAKLKNLAQEVLERQQIEIEQPE